MKILIVANNASSRFGGESFIPLKYFQLLRRRGYTVHLIAHSRNRDDLQETLGTDCKYVLYVEDSRWHRAVWRVGSVFPRRIREALFENILGFINQRFQSKIIRHVVQHGGADVIHQPIPVSPRAPSSIHGFGPPVIIGPMNGGMSYPPGYEDYESRIERIFVRVSRAAAGIANWLVPGKRRAAALLVANPRTRAALPVRNHPNVIDLVENGVDFAIWSAEYLQYEVPESPHRSPAAIRLVFMGRLVKLKALDITFQAIAIALREGVSVEIDILGDGEEKDCLRRLCESLNITSSVRFHGFRTQPECFDILRRSDALILNSIHECGGAVVLEAMSVGLPVIASDWGGPADYIDPSCGVLVPPCPRANFAQRIANAIALLARNPSLRASMGRAGARKARQEYDWSKKIDRILEIYRDAVLTSKSGSPDEPVGPESNVVVM